MLSHYNKSAISVEIALFYGLNSTRKAVDFSSGHLLELFVEIGV